MHVHFLFRFLAASTKCFTSLCIAKRFCQARRMLCSLRLRILFQPDVDCFTFGWLTTPIVWLVDYAHCLAG